MLGAHGISRELRGSKGSEFGANCWHLGQTPREKSYFEQHHAKIAATHSPTVTMPTCKKELPSQGRRVLELCLLLRLQGGYLPGTCLSQFSASITPTTCKGGVLRCLHGGHPTNLRHLLPTSVFFFDGSFRLAEAAYVSGLQTLIGDGRGLRSSFQNRTTPRKARVYIQMSSRKVSSTLQTV